MSLLPSNARILEYKILAHLGSGGFANTYLALDVNLDKKVAIKEFFPRRLCERDGEFNVHPIEGAEAEFATYLKNFVTEAQILAKFDEKNVVKVLRYFEGLGTAFIIMEFVEGKHLDDFISENELIPEETLHRWLTGILGGLNVLHENSIIHGDIKPKNILINGENEPVLIDFGASVAYNARTDESGATGTIVLTENYAAPEQFDVGTAPDHRIDVYALGCVFYELITHQKFRWKNEDNPSQILDYGRYYHKKLLGSIERALQSDRDRRYDDAEEWLNFLTLLRIQKVGRSIRRHKILYGLAASVVAVAAYSAWYIVEHDVDQRNYQYKLLASPELVNRNLDLGAQAIGRMEGAADALTRYRNEYGHRVSLIEQRDLTAGRSNLASLTAVSDRTGKIISTLRGLARAVSVAREKYYFDDYDALIDQADQVISGVDKQVTSFNRDLFAAVLESEIVRRGREAGVAIDNVPLTSLLNETRRLTDRIPPERITSLAAPVADGFLRDQRERNRLQALEGARSKVAAEVNELYRQYKSWAGSDALKGHLATISAAGSRLELEQRRKEAHNIVEGIKRRREKAIATRKRLQFAARVRAAVRDIEGQMIGVDAGAFIMGSDKQGFAQPPHQVQVRRFHLARNEVTVGQWEMCVRGMGCPAIKAAGGKDFPITGVSWNDANRFIAWLNRNSRRFRFRLPSEAEWEFIVSKYGFRLKELESGLGSVQVKNTNNKGINSIIGNALEWLDDCWHGGYTGAPRDGRSWNEGLQCDKRIVRGANWEGKYIITEANARFYRPFGVKKEAKMKMLGFRLAGNPR